MSTTSVSVPMDDVSRAQQDLGRALDRARIGEDRALANQVRDLGERMAHQLAGLIKMTRLHTPDNAAFDHPVEDLHTTIAQLQDLLGSVHLVAVEDQVYVNEIRIRTGERATGIRELGGELQRHNVGGITFHEAPSGPSIRALVGNLGGAAPSSGPRTALAHALANAGVEGMELHGRFRFRVSGESVQQAADPRDFLTRAISAADEAFQNLAAGRIPNPLPLRRLMTEFLQGDLLAEAMWVDPPGVPPLALHQFRVAHLSIIIGSRVGLPESVLQDLGVAALYHDCGYAAPVTQGRLDVHAPQGALLLLRQKGFHEGKLRRILAVLEHHRDASATPLRPGLLGRILRIAADYDTLVRRTGSLTPTAALGAMVAAGQARYDPILLQLLVNALGAYPPGSLLRLRDGAVVRTVAPPPTAEGWAWPPARRSAPDGTPGALVDLRKSEVAGVVSPGRGAGAPAH